MTMMFDTPDDIAFVRACSRKGALSLELKGMKKRGQTAYSIVKEVYGFRGTRTSVLEDITEFVEAWLRLRKLPPEDYEFATKATQVQVEYLKELGKFNQPHFEAIIANGEADGHITHEQRQNMSDLFYVSIVRQNAGNR